MRKIRLGVQIHPQHAEYDAIRKAVVEAEELGFDIVFNWDHSYPLYGDPDGFHSECWTMLASFAEVTGRVEIGPLVTCTSYRNPQHLADMAGTFDHVSRGRVILGLGSGWFERDCTPDIWHTFGDADTIRRKNTVLDEWCARVGRDPAEIERSAGVGRSGFGDPSFGDTLLDAGADQLTFGMDGLECDLAPLREWVAWRDERNAAR